MQTTTHEKMTEKAIQPLNDLIEINIDSAKGFRETADNLVSDMYEQLFRDVADERERQAEELRGLIKSEGETPAEDGSISGTAHRWWAKLRDKLTDSSNYSVLAEAERGEDHILHLYQDVEKQVRDTVAHELVDNHLAQVKRRHDQVRDLRDKAKELEDRG